MKHNLHSLSQQSNKWFTSERWPWRWAIATSWKKISGIREYLWYMKMRNIEENIGCAHVVQTDQRKLYKHPVQERKEIISRENQRLNKATLTMHTHAKIDKIQKNIKNKTAYKIFRFLFLIVLQWLRYIFIPQKSWTFLDKKK